jgi:hypothetical protein
MLPVTLLGNRVILICVNKEDINFQGIALWNVTPCDLIETR